MAKGVCVASGSLLLLLLFGACASSERSVTLSLSLVSGMERKMKFTTEQQVSSLRPGSSTVSPSTVISFTYRFRVASVGPSGTAQVECSVLDIDVSKGIAGADASVESLRRQSFVATVDTSGRVLDVRTDQPRGFVMQGFPIAPGTLAQSVPAPGDMEVLLGGLNGQRVSVGETWISALSQSRSGLRGSLRWTLASVSGSTVRLAYTGILDEQEVPIPLLPIDTRAFLAGDAGGFVELEKETGWPRHGKMVIRAAVSLRESGAAVGAAPVLVSMRIVTQFDAVP